MRQSDGAYWAVLSWEESGGWVSMLTERGNYCVTQIWESESDDGQVGYRYTDLCGSGLEGVKGGDGDVYFEYLGRTYYAPWVRVAERPG